MDTWSIPFSPITTNFVSRFSELLNTLSKYVSILGPTACMVNLKGLPFTATNPLSLKISWSLITSKINFENSSGLSISPVDIIKLSKSS